MKKLLAIAVAAAITVPMAASADTKVYGQAHMTLSDDDTKDANGNASGWNVSSRSSRIGMKGSNAMDNGLSLTHKIEMDVDGLVDDKDGNGKAPIQARDSWLGLKSGFGEVRVGRHTLPDLIGSGPANFMTWGTYDYLLDGKYRVPNALAYINKFGNVGFAVAQTIGNEKNATDSATDFMVNYSAGPLYASVGALMPKDHKPGAKVALAYKGANYGIGLVAGKKVISDADDTAGKTAESFTSLSGKYSFGKAYFAAQVSKEKESEVSDNILELGYGLGKGSKVYFEHAQLGTSATKVKTNTLGFQHNF